MPGQVILQTRTTVMIDLIYALVILLAIFKGYQKGFVIALFSIIAFIVGLAAALKLSSAVAAYLQNSTTISSGWLPVISFAIVFIIVVILVNLGGKLIERSIEMVMLGWLNRIGGILLYIILYTIIFSIILFYSDSMELYEKSTVASSRVYPWVQPLGPKIINRFAQMVPLFKDMFTQLEAFFEGVSNKMTH